MKNLKTLLGLCALLLLSSCGFTAPPSPSTWVSTVHGVEITWTFVAPGSLNKDSSTGYVGMAYSVITGRKCAVKIDPARLGDVSLTRVAAHEAGHCLQSAYLLPGFSRPDIGNYYAAPLEGFAESYAQLYLNRCAYSRQALGWPDSNKTCDQAPHPREVTGQEKHQYQ